MKYLFFISTIAFNLSAYAHGENKLGPHDGYIRMPGSFHTELVPNHEDAYSVYLMDVNNQNAITKDSNVKLTYQSLKGKKIDFTCFPVDDHFTCKLGNKINSKEGKYLLKATRNKVEGKVAEYPLPLALTGEASTTTGHEGHNMKGN